MRWVHPILARLSMRSNTAPPPQLALSPTPFHVDPTKVGQTRSKDLKFLNAGGGTLIVSRIECQDGPCAPFTVPAGEIRLSADAATSVPIEFRPQSAGEVERTLKIWNNDPLDQPNGWTGFVISGTGLAAGDILVTPTTLSFGSVKIGETTTGAFTIKNVGAGTLVVEGIKFDFASSGFSVDTGGSFSLAPGDDPRVITVRFAPNVGGIETGRLAITSDDQNERISYVDLEGNGLAGRIELSATVLDFGDVGIGDERGRKMVCRNTGDAPLKLTRMTTRYAHYNVSPRAPVTVAVGDSLDLFVTLAPTDVGDGADTLTIESNDPRRRSVDVSLRGRIVWAGYSLSSEWLRFGGVEVGQSASLDLIIVSGGALWLDVDEAFIDDGTSGTGPFGIPSFVPFSIQPGDRGGIAVTFSPTSMDDFDARLELVTNAHRPPPAPELSGSSRPIMTTTPTSLGFGSVLLGTKKRRAVSISNTGSTLLRVTGAVVAPVSGAPFPFALDPFVPFTLQPRSSKQLWVAFQPSVEDEHSAALVIKSNDPKRPTVSVPLTGFGRSQSPESTDAGY